MKKPFFLRSISIDEYITGNVKDGDKFIEFIQATSPHNSRHFRTMPEAVFAAERVMERDHNQTCLIFDTTRKQNMLAVMMNWTADLLDTPGRYQMISFGEAG